MADRRENSLLFSLNELKELEVQRQEEEAESKRAAEEAARRAIEDAERRKREEEEAKIRAVQDAERKERERKEQLAREEKMRIDEAERKARVEAEARIEEARLIKETQERIKKALPYKLIAMVGGAILLIAAIIAGLVIKKYIDEQNVEAAQLAAQRKAEKEKEE